MSNTNKRNIAVGILSRDGTWLIMPVTFSLDPSDNFRPYYPQKIDLGGETLQYLKVTKSGRMLYKQL